MRGLSAQGTAQRELRAVPLWGGFATFQRRCFGAYLRAESEQQVEGAVWKASCLAKAS